MGGDDLTMKDEWSLSREIVPVVVPIANPSVGADWSVNVPPGAVWKVFSILATLVTSSTVATRSVIISISDGTSEFCRVGAKTTMAASQTVVWSWAAGTGFSDTAPGLGPSSLPAAGFYIPGGYSISSKTLNMQNGDQWSKIVVYANEARMRRVDSEARDLGRFDNAIDTRLLHGW